MQYETAVISHKGGREANQDYAAFSEFKEGGCWVLADGLGGYQAGEVASKLAVDTILQESQQNRDSQWMKTGIEKAQANLQLQQKSAPIYRSMRTTVVALSFENARAILAHVGDSRLYHIRDGNILSQKPRIIVYVKHSLTREKITTNDIRALHEDRNRLYRVLGSEGNACAAIRKEEVLLQQGDAFFLCTDGFWEYVTEEEMESTRMRASTPSQWLQMMESILQERISEKSDNYSGVAVFVCDEKILGNEVK